eukprot:c20171_g1_i1 orf=206-1270(+)
MAVQEEDSTFLLLFCLCSLFFALISTLVSSFIYSVCLFFRAISTNYIVSAISGVFSCIGSPHLPANTEVAAVNCLFYEGKVWHERQQPILHKFEYSVRYAFVNLDFPPAWFTSASAVYHMNAEEARIISGTTGPVYLLTIPTSVGYEQNPISVYYCYDGGGFPDGRVIKCIAEVTNTPWAERVVFTFEPEGDAVAKPLHVSPFMDMLGSWKIRASIPGYQLSVTVAIEHPKMGRYFTAMLQTRRVNCSLRNPDLFLWLMPHKVAAAIYWQAMKLWWKGILFCSHPKYIEGNMYRKRAIEHDQELKFVHKKMLKESTMCQASSIKDALSQWPTMQGNELGNPRFCTWQDAHWPWA